MNRIVKALLPASSITEYKAAAALHVAEPAEASADDLARLALGGVKA